MVDTPRTDSYGRSSADTALPSDVGVRLARRTPPDPGHARSLALCRDRVRSCGVHFGPRFPFTVSAEGCPSLSGISVLNRNSLLNWDFRLDVLAVPSVRFSCHRHKQYESSQRFAESHGNLALQQGSDPRGILISLIGVFQASDFFHRSHPPVVRKVGSLILSRFQDETNYDTIVACQGHDISIGSSSRKRKPSLPKPPISAA